MNRSNKGANTNTIQMIEDIFVLLIVYLIERKAFEKVILPTSNLKCFALVVVFIVIYILANKEARIYNVTLFFYLDRFWKIISKSWLLASGITMGLMYVYNPHYNIRRFHLYYIAWTYAAICINMVLSRFLQMMFTNIQAPRAAFVGTFEEYEKFNYFLNKTSMKVEEVGYILDSEMPEKKVFNTLGKIEDLEQIIRNKEIDQVYFIQHSDDNIAQIQKYIDICLEMGVTVRVVLDVSYSHRMLRSNSYVSSVGTFPLITYHTIALNSYEQALKRVMDIVISAIATIVLSPIMLITAVAIKLDSPGPVIFKQMRVGQNGRTFNMYKFRSMCIDAEARKEELLQKNEMDGFMFKIKDDPRVTKVGKFIRKTSIDELPQLFNVIKGDMSLVGTRPPTVDEVSKYERGQWRRISIKPGVTGLWQISGRNSITDFDEVVELDLRYIDNWSLSADIAILIKTVGVLFTRKGAY
ncbi:sugar transferase [Butyrivibrio proteoclasticus]|uniref:sugar transferase n=1 Tax=Butyrivibrio proteoclasticus TaxID=43305 RepID=UPI00047A474E|nr:sugar transferase [Butyrivibrio proteoclasticus]